MNTSNKQIAANRKNALQSTGPQDTSKTRFNATKHGILTRDVLIRQKLRKENPKAFNDLVNDLIIDLQPVGRIELLLVEKIAMELWRLRRLYKTESSRLNEQYKTIVKDAAEQLEMELRLDSSFSIPGDEIKLPPLRSLVKLSEDREHLLEGIQNRTATPEEIRKQLPVDTESEGEEFFKEAEAACERALGIIDAFFDAYEHRLGEKQKELIEDRRLPRNFELILRYDTTITNNLYRALHELERLQSNRRGETRPKVDVTINKE